MKNKRTIARRGVAVLLSLVAIGGIFMASTWRYWWWKAPHAAVYVNGKLDNQALIYQSPRGELMFIAGDNTESDRAGRYACYIVTRSRDNATAGMAVTPRKLYEGGFDFLLLPGAALRNVEPLHRYPLGKKDEDPHDTYAKDHVEFTDAQENQVRLVYNER